MERILLAGRLVAQDLDIPEGICVRTPTYGYNENTVVITVDAALPHPDSDGNTHVMSSKTLDATQLRTMMPPTLTKYFENTYQTAIREVVDNLAEYTQTSQGEE